MQCKLQPYSSTKKLLTMAKTNTSKATTDKKPAIAKKPAAVEK
jgi:hypothetical protein